MFIFGFMTMKARNKNSLPPSKLQKNIFEKKKNNLHRTF